MPSRQRRSFARLTSGRLQDGRPREALRLPDAHEELRGPPPSQREGHGSRAPKRQEPQVSSHVWTLGLSRGVPDAIRQRRARIAATQRLGAHGERPRLPSGVAAANPKGGFMMHEEGETDMRGTYCAAASAPGRPWRSQKPLRGPSSRSLAICPFGRRGDSHGFQRSTVKLFAGGQQQLAAPSQICTRRAAVPRPWPWRQCSTS